MVRSGLLANRSTAAEIVPSSADNDGPIAAVYRLSNGLDQSLPACYQVAPSHLDAMPPSSCSPFRSPEARTGMQVYHQSYSLFCLFCWLVDT